MIAVRDSKNPDGPKLTFDTATWRAFTRDAVSRVQCGHPTPAARVA